MQGLSLKKNIVLSTTVLAAVLFLAGFYIARHRDLFSRILSLNVLQYSTLSLLVVLGVLNNGFMLYHYLKNAGIHMPVKEWLSLSALTTVGNQLLFRGGALAKAFYLKKKHAFAFSRFLPIVWAQFIISLFAIGWMGIAGIGWLGLTGRGMDAMPMFVFLAVILVPVLVLKLSPDKLPGWLGRNQYVDQMFDSWQSLCGNYSILKVLTVLSIVNIVLYICRLYAAFHYVGADVPFINIYFIALLGILTDFVGIVPGGIGVKEAIVGFVTELYGGKMAEGIVAASLDRAVLVVWVVFLGAIALVYLIGRNCRKKDASTDETGE